MTFQPGYAKMYSNYAKQYHLFLQANRQRRYAGHGRIHFKTATEALRYAWYWAIQAEKILQRQEVKP